MTKRFLARVFRVLGRLWTRFKLYLVAHHLVWLRPLYFFLVYCVFVLATALMPKSRRERMIAATRPSGWQPYPVSVQDAYVYTQEIGRNGQPLRLGTTARCLQHALRFGYRLSAGQTTAQRPVEHIYTLF